MKKPATCAQPLSFFKRLSPRLIFLLAWAVAVPLALHSAPPSWWQDQSVTTGRTPNDYAAINQGQLKYLAKSAITSMNANLPGGAGQTLNAMALGWQNPTRGTNDYSSINLGQLKNLAQPFYDRLMLAGLAEEYPWSYSQITPNDYALANVGQAKQMFSFPIPTSNQRAIWGPSMSPTGGAGFGLNTTGQGTGVGTVYPSLSLLGTGAPVDKSVSDVVWPQNPQDPPDYSVPFSYTVNTNSKTETTGDDGSDDVQQSTSSTDIHGDLVYVNADMQGTVTVTKTDYTATQYDWVTINVCANVYNTYANSEPVDITTVQQACTSGSGSCKCGCLSASDGTDGCTCDSNQYQLVVYVAHDVNYHTVTTVTKTCTGFQCNLTCDTAAHPDATVVVSVWQYSGSPDSDGNDPSSSGWTASPGSPFALGLLDLPPGSTSGASLDGPNATAGTEYIINASKAQEGGNPDNTNKSAVLTASDAAGPKYRKIGLNGVPMPDSKPQNQDESGEEPEETYIDALNRQLRHSSTDVYVPLASSLLPLSVRRDVADEGWDTRSGTRGSERPDRPFGMGWSSNICGSVTVNGEYWQTPNQNFVYWIKDVVVTDEQGSGATYINVPGTHFWIHDRAERQNVRTVNNTLSGIYDAGGNLTGFIYVKKFGTTCTYEMTDIVQQYNGDRLLPKAGTYPIVKYMRMKSVVDRYGDQLQYYYADTSTGRKITLIPALISDPARLGHQIQITQGNGVVTQVMAPNGDVIKYGYDFSIFDGSGFVPTLMTVTKGREPDVSVAQYGYNLETETDPTPSPQDLQYGTVHQFMHLGVSSITDELGHQYQFTLSKNQDSTYADYNTHSGLQIRTQIGLPRYVDKVLLPNTTYTNFTGKCSVDALGGGSANMQAVGFAGTFSWSFSGATVWRQTLPDPNPDPNSTSTRTTIAFSVLDRTGPLGTEEYKFQSGFNSCNGLISSQDVSGNKTTFVNDGNWDDPISQTNALGKTRTFTYDAHTRVMASLTDERGVSTVWTIDTMGRRKQEVISGPGGGGTTTIFGYDGTFLGFLASKIVSGGLNPGTITTNYKPDTVGRVAVETVISDYWNVPIGHSYDGNGNKTSVSDGNGCVTRFQYDTHNRLVVITYPDTLTKQLTYDAHGNVTQEIDDVGNVTKHGYDALNRLQTTELDLVSGSGVSIKTITFTYNAYNEVLTQVESPGAITTNHYDPGGRLDRKSVGYIDGDPRNQITQYFYQAGRNCGGEVFETSGFRPSSVIDPKSHTTNFYYDNLYRTLEKDEPEGRTTTYVLDDDGNQTSVNCSGFVVQTVFDCLNRPVIITNPDGTMRSMAYSVNGKISQLTDEMGYVTQSYYNGGGLPVKVVTPRGAVVQTVYDANGNAVASCDAMGNVTQTLYDNRNRPWQITAAPIPGGPNGTYINPVTTNLYENGGLKVTTTDPLQRQVITTKDGAHRVLTVIDPLGGKTATTYDPNGNALTVTDANGALTKNGYDVFNHLTSTKDPNGLTTAFGYDFNGNKSSVTDALNQETQFYYDGLNRLITEIRQGGVTATHAYDALYERSRYDGIHTISFPEYDLRGRLKTTTLPEGSRTMTYDNLGRLLTVSESSPALGGTSDVTYTYDLDGHVETETSRGVTQAYTSDLAGRRFKTVYGTGRTVVTSFDGQGHVIGETDGSNMTNWYYDAAGQMIAKWLPNGQYETNEYDLNGRLHDRKLYQTKATPASAPSNLLVEFGWEHDGIGTVKSQSENWVGSTRAAAQRVTAMGYYANYWLKSEIVAEGTTTTETDYTYYDSGNRETMTKKVNGTVQTSTSYTYDNDNELKTWSETDGANSLLRSAILSYDAAGNRTGQALTIAGAANVQTTTYTWDSENRLSGVSLPDGRNFAYGYDYRHRRVTKSEPSGGAGSIPRVTGVVFSGGVSQAEYPVNSFTGAIPIAQVATVDYQRGPDAGGGVGGLLYSVRGGVQNFDLSDGRGDVVGQTNSAGALTWTASYEAYGKRTEETGTNLDPQRGNSKDEDATGLLDEGFRYRDLETGVFLSRDPAGFVDGPNVYAYVHCNPWTSFDPEGLSETWYWRWGASSGWGPFMNTLEVLSAPVHAVFDAVAIPIEHFAGAGKQFNKETSHGSAFDRSVEQYFDSGGDPARGAPSPEAIRNAQVTEQKETLSASVNVAMTTPGTTITGPAATPTSSGISSIESTAEREVAKAVDAQLSTLRDEAAALLGKGTKYKSTAIGQYADGSLGIASSDTLVPRVQREWAKQKGIRVINGDGHAEMTLKNGATDETGPLVKFEIDSPHGRSPTNPNGQMCKDCARDATSDGATTSATSSGRSSPKRKDPNE